MTTIPRQSELTAALALHGLDAIPADHTGTTLDAAWTDAFGQLDEPAPTDPVEVAYDQLGHPDLGRLRGGPYIVWHDDRLPYDASEEDGQWLLARDHPEGFDNEHLHLAAQFHTRNGGGNRECYCDSRNANSAGCLAEVIDALTDHSAYLHDADDDFDSTYADFWFKLEVTREMRQAVLADQVLRQRRAAEARLAEITSGEAGPWVVLAVNVQTRELLEQAQNDAKTSPGKIPALACGFVWSGAASAALADIDAAIAYLDGSVPEVPVIDRAEVWTHVRLGDSMAWLTEAQRFRKELAAYEATARDVDAGTLPQHVVDVLELQRWLPEIPFLRERAESFEKRARTALGELKADRDALATWLARTVARDAARQRVTDLTWALSWPGDVSTCPPRRQPVRDLHFF